MSQSTPATTTTTTTTNAQNPPVHIRPAHPADAAPIAALGAAVFSTTFGHSVSAAELQAFLDATYTPAAIAADLQDASKDTLLAVSQEDDTAILGFAVLTRGSSEPCVDAVADKAELQRIYVSLDAHGRGVGGRLARAVENLARDQGFRNMWLGVWEENLVAIRAYEKWGYRTVGHHDFVIGTVVQTDLIMTKAL